MIVGDERGVEHIVIERLRDDARVSGRRWNADADVGLAEMQCTKLAVEPSLDHADLDGWIALARALDDSADEPRGESACANADHAAAGRALAGASCPLCRCVHLAQDVTRRGESHLSGRRQSHSLRPSLEQLDVELALQRVDLSSQGGLRHGQPLGGGDERVLLSGSSEVA